MPDAVGVPLIVIVLLAHAAVTPEGSPVVVPIPVAPVVVCVIAVVNAVLIHNVGVLEAALIVLMQGVTDEEVKEETELPTAFVATTVKVYVVPLVNPVTIMGEVAPVAVIPPGLEVTVYPVIGLPPVLLGATNATLAEASPTVATILVGEPGTVVIITVILPVAFIVPQPPVRGII